MSAPCGISPLIDRTTRCWGDRLIRCAVPVSRPEHRAVVRWIQHLIHTTCIIPEPAETVTPSPRHGSEIVESELVARNPFPVLRGGSQEPGQCLLCEGEQDHENDRCKEQSVKSQHDRTQCVREHQ